MLSYRRNLYVIAGVVVVILVLLVWFLISGRFANQRNSNGFKREYRVIRGSIDAHYAARDALRGRHRRKSSWRRALSAACWKLP